MGLSSSSWKIDVVGLLPHDKRAEGLGVHRPSALAFVDRLGLRRPHRTPAVAIVTIALLLPRVSMADIEVPYDAPTIEEAVAMAQDGERIRVYPGDYEVAGTIEIWWDLDRKDVNLRAVGGPSVTRVRLRPGRDCWRLFLALCDNFTVEGFTFFVQPGQIAITWSAVYREPVVGGGITIRGDVSRGIWRNPGLRPPLFSGIGAYVAGPGVIADNEFYDLWAGIRTEACGACWGGNDGKTPLMLERNQFRRCYTGVEGDGFYREAPRVYVSDNEFEECYVGVYAAYCAVSNNVIRDCARGLQVSKSVAEGNWITGSQRGIEIYQGPNRFVRNILVSSAPGLAVYFYSEPGAGASIFGKRTILYGRGGALVTNRRKYDVSFIDSILRPLPGEEDSPFLRTCLDVGDPDPCPPPERHANVEASYCAVYGRQIDGPGVIHDDPEFWDPEGGDFRLRPTSPCINRSSRG